MLLKATFRRPARQDIDLSTMPGMPALSKIKVLPYDDVKWDEARSATLDQDQDDHPGHALKTEASSAMTTIRLDSVSRSFGAVRAVDNVSATIEEGKLFTLLGPSGCGKTTLLRMIAGFAEVEAGSIWFDDRRIDTLPAHRRNTGMVFQNYAIFPNLTVEGNVAYGLRARKVNPADIRARVEKALERVRLARLRIALAASALGRAIAARGDRPRARHRTGGAAVR